MDNPCVRLETGSDGVWAHFHVPGGVYWSINVSVQGTMASRFGSQYREWFATQPVVDPGYTLDAFDENDLCDSFAGLPVEFFNPGPSFGT